MQHTLNISTARQKEIVDITDRVGKLVADAGDGVCSLFIHHTTAALTTADLDPGTDEDMLDAFAAMVPNLSYRHPHDPSHVGDHIMASIIGPSVTIPVTAGQLVLGTWQRVVLVELDGPRERTITLSM